MTYKILKFVQFKLIELQKLLQTVKKIGPFSPLIKFWTANLLVYSIIYPTIRLFRNRVNSIRFCEKFIKTPSETISIPKLLKSKLILKNNEDWIAFIETHLRDSYDKKTLQSGLNVVDIGAHIGTYTILAAEKVGENGKVIAIEPELKNYELLTKNINLNNFKNIIPVKIALSDHNGIEKLYFYSRSTCHSLLPENDKKNDFIEIEVQTLDSLLEKLNLQKIDIIKIDTEGAEIPILKGAEKTLRNNPDVKIFVASYHYPEEMQEVKELLESFNFKTKTLMDIVTTL